MIWSAVLVTDYATVQTCLELNDVPVFLKNDGANAVLSMESVSGTEIWITEEDYPRALDILHQNGHINEKQLLEAIDGMQGNTEPNPYEGFGKKYKREIAVGVAVVVVVTLWALNA